METKDVIVQMREALEMYASPIQYEAPHLEDAPIFNDKGEMARKALESLTTLGQQLLSKRN